VYRVEVIKTNVTAIAAEKIFVTAALTSSTPVPNTYREISIIQPIPDITVNFENFLIVNHLR
jgi:hypothetical protein